MWKSAPVCLAPCVVLKPKHGSAVLQETRQQLRFRAQRALMSGDPTALRLIRGTFVCQERLKAYLLLMKILTKNEGVVQRREVTSSTKT